jgi:hypothetical protein
VIAREAITFADLQETGGFQPVFQPGLISGAPIAVAYQQAWHSRLDQMKLPHSMSAGLCGPA